MEELVHRAADEEPIQEPVLAEPDREQVGPSTRVRQFGGSTSDRDHAANAETLHESIELLARDGVLLVDRSTQPRTRVGRGLDHRLDDVDHTHVRVVATSDAYGFDEGGLRLPAPVVPDHDAP